MPNGSQPELRFLFSLLSPHLDLSVVDFTAREQISSCFQVDLTLAAEEEVDFDTVIGKEALLTIRGEETDRCFHGIISELMFLGSRGTYYLYQARMVPSLWGLSLEQDARIFQNKTVQEIVTRVLGDAAISSDRFTFRPESIGGNSREFCVQYRETDLDFITRLLMEEGIFYFFEHTEERHLLVFGDSSAVYQGIEGAPSEGGDSPEIMFHFSEGRIPEEETIYKFSFSRRMYSGKVTLRDFDFLSPSAHHTSLTTESQDREENFHRLAVYDYPGRYTDGEIGQKLAQIRLERAMLFKEKGEGESTSARLVPGFKFTLSDHDMDAFNREYLLVEVVHTGAQPQVLEEWADEKLEFRYSNRFVCIPGDVPFRPLDGKPKPKVEGPQTAIVVGPSGEEIYTDDDGHGRVKVQFHWDREGQFNEESSCWVRVSQTWAGGGYGHLSLPRIGHEVIVSFLEGDADRPLITGRVYNADHHPPVSLPDEKTKSTIKTKSYKGEGANEISFEDNAGSEQIFIHAQKDLDIKALGNQKTTVEKEHHLVVKEAAKIKVGSSDLTVEEDGAVKVGGKQSVTVTGDMLEKFGNHMEDSGGEIYLKAGTKIIIEAGAQLSLKGPGGFVDIGPAGVTIQGNIVNINSGGAAGSPGISGSPTDPEVPDETETTSFGTDTPYSPVATRVIARVEEPAPAPEPEIEAEEDTEEEEEAVLLEIVQVDERFAPGVENLNIQYNIAGLAGQRVVLKIICDQYPANPIYEQAFTADQRSNGNGKALTWDGRANIAGDSINGNHISPIYSPYRVVLEADSGERDEGPTRVEIFRITLDPIGTGNKLMMNNPAEEFETIATVEIMRMDGTGAVTPIDIEVRYSFQDPGGNNTTKAAAYVYSPPDTALGKAGDANAIFWRAHPECRAVSDDGFKTQCSVHTVTAAGPNQGKAKIYFKPAGVGGDDYTLTGKVLASDTTTSLSEETSPTKVVWRRIEFTGYEMAGQTHVSTHGTDATMATYYTAATFVEYSLGTVTTITATYCGAYIGLWDHASSTFKTWATVKAKTPAETPTADETTKANNPAAPGHTAARAAVQTKANAWKDRIVREYTDGLNTWASDAGIPANVIVAIEYEHPKYSAAAPASDGTTTEWGAFPWLTISVESFNGHPDRRWIQGQGLSYGNRAYITAGMSAARTKVVVAHEAGHETKNQFRRKLFGGGDHSTTAGLMDPTGSRNAFTATETDTLKGLR